MAPKQTAIFEKAAECLHAFNACIESATTSSWPQDQLDRFNLWAAHGGIFGAYSSHTSMDWRLRERPELVEMMLLLLELLQGYLGRIRIVRGAATDVVVGTEEPSGQRVPASPIISPTQSTDSSECSIIIPSVERPDITVDPADAVKRDAENVITKLFRLSAVIRSAGMSYRHQKAANYVQWEDGVNLTQKFRDGIKLLLKHKKPPLEEFISKRLLESICLRQRQIAYSQRHKLISSSNTAQSGSSAEATPVIPPRSESNYRHRQSVTSSLLRRTAGDAKPLPGEDSADKKGAAPKSAIYTATYVPTTISQISKSVPAQVVHKALGTIDDSLDTLPPPPVTLDSTKEFICPFCAIPLEKASYHGSLWRSHALKDIRPYICILPDCKTPYALYADGVSWVNHMRTDHTTTRWKCSNTSHTEPLIFDTEVQFTAHAHSSHGKFTGEEVIELAALSSFQTPRELAAMAWSKCPICTVSLDGSDFMSACCHIANDLLEFALHSLPDSPDLAESQSLQVSDSLRVSSDAAMGRHENSETVTDQTHLWSSWDADMSQAAEKDLQAYESDLIVSSYMNPEHSHELDRVWETIRLKNTERMKTEPDPSQTLRREYPNDVSLLKSLNSSHASTNSDELTSSESRSGQLETVPSTLQRNPRDLDILDPLAGHIPRRSMVSDTNTANRTKIRLLHRTENGSINLTEWLPSNVPKYAILSHTWGDEEVLFENIIDGVGAQKVGYKKIEFCGRQAASDGLSYFWVDTCCINKSDGSELSEAINSMFRWYKEAVICYVFLSDVSSGGSLQDTTQWESAFRHSKWFTRGWTLPELLAPQFIKFFSREGQILGDKQSLENQIYDITRIGISALRGRTLSNFSVHERMSWAYGRHTTREEDMAYCLFGILGVQLSANYGEGKAGAMRRLQDEIDINTEAPWGRISMMRSHLMSLYKTLDTHWVCVRGDCLGLSVGLSLPQQMNASTADTSFSVFFHMNNEPAMTLQEAKITVTDERGKKVGDVSASKLGNAEKSTDLCHILRESLDLEIRPQFRVNAGVFQTLNPQKKVFGGVNMPRTISLSALFNHQQELPDSASVLPLKGKRVLAVILASALQPFLETSWLLPSFSYSNIQFLEPLSEVELPEITKPFLVVEHIPWGKLDTGSSPGNDKHLIHPHLSVLKLAILLCELHYCTPIERMQKDQKAPRNVNTDYYTCIDLLENLEDDAGVDYYLATKACLQCEYLPDGPAASFDSGRVQRLFYQNVVKRLEAVIFKAWGLRLGDLDSFDVKQNESCWGVARDIFRHQIGRVSIERSLNLFDASYQTGYPQDHQLSDQWMHKLLSSIHSRIDGYEIEDPDRRISRSVRMSRPVKIAILDSGFDPENPLLSADIAKFRSRIQFSQSFVRQSSRLAVRDGIGHGTHALGLLLNIAKNAEIYIAKVTHQGTLGEKTDAINCAVNEWDVDIISMPFGLREYSQSIHDAIFNALKKQTLLFAAASNDGGNLGRTFPAKHPGVFCIHSTDGMGNSSIFNPAAHVRDVNFSILGEHVSSHWPSGIKGHNKNVNILSGTSIATSIAAGVAASVLSFVRQHEQSVFQEGGPLLGPWLKDYESMQLVLQKMASQRDGYDYIMPHSLFDDKLTDAEIYNQIKDIRRQLR
ncbi:Vegetative incompatibility protein [Paramyrothecium foliicola]|nr:Vegetative incompatibility protein [Paramyrothecium foliicola]